MGPRFLAAPTPTCTPDNITHAHDANCCPSSFRKRRFTWTGSHFKAGNAKKLKTAPRRFYRP